MAIRETAIKINTLVHKRYRIQAILGHGGFGRTYLARDESQHNSLCVLKEFSPASRLDDQEILQKAVELFKRETQILSRLNHPQIPQFIYQFHEKHRIFIVQEYIKGKNYFELLKSQGAFAESEILEWLRSLLDVLVYIHSKNILHRDITLDNIIFSDSLRLPVLIDFGVVKETVDQLDKNQETGLSKPTVVGKVGYAAIEQIRTGQCSPSSDLYSLGVCAIVLLTGKEPDQLVDHHSQQWIWSSFAKVSHSTEAILNKMIAEKPMDRYQSAHEVIRDLGQKTQIYQPPKSNPAFTQIRQPNLNIFNDQGSTQSETFSKLTEPSNEISTHSYWPNHNNENSVDTNYLDEDYLEEETPELDNPDKSRKSKSKIKKQKRLILLGAFSFVVMTTGIISLGIYSPYINPICRLLDQCIADQKYEEIYARLHDSFNILQQESRNAEALAILTSMPEILKENLDQLQAVPENAKIYPDVVQLTHDYERQLEEVESTIKAFQILDASEDGFQNLKTKVEEANSLENLLDIETELNKTLKENLQPLEEESAYFNNNYIRTRISELLLNYQSQASALSDRIKKEQEIQRLISDAKGIAATAEARTKDAHNVKTLQQYRSARELWSSALRKLSTIPGETLFKEEISQLRNTYQGQVAQLNKKINEIEAINRTPLPSSPESGSSSGGRLPPPPPARRPLPPPPDPPQNVRPEPIWPRPPGEEPLWFLDFDRN